jgi:sec-independent protein translocase protein TatA
MIDVLLFVSGQEIFIVALVVLVLFGASKIPELARGLGKGMREFRKATDEIKKEITDSSAGVMEDVKDIKKDLDDVSSNLTKDANNISKNINN